MTQPGIIDIHTHVFPDKVADRAVPNMYRYCKIPYRSGGSASQLLESMRKGGITLSVNHPVCTNPAKVESCNRFAQQLATQPGILSFGCVHPEDPNWREELRTFRRRGLLGLKIHNDYQQFDFDSKLCMDIIEAAFEEGLIVLAHAGADPVSPGKTRCTPRMIANAMPLLRQGNFIAAHLGGNLMLDEAMRWVIGQDIYVDTSMAAMYYSDVMCRQAILNHDPDKVLFGSDSPWDDPGTAAAVLRHMDLGEELLQKILYGNAARLLKLEEQSVRPAAG